MERDFIQELKWRGMLYDSTPGTDELLASKKVVGYIGFDPTAPSLTIGNLVQLTILKLFQLHGHTPIVLMGGATGRIGDPSGRDKERILKTGDELDNNLSHQLKQMKRFLDFDNVENKAIIINNYDIYKDMGVLDFLRDVGKNITINTMMSKDSVKNRLETGLSFTEFSYQLLQANDFLHLYKKYDCVLQMGGSDQWGNITAGTEFIRKNMENSKAYAVTTPLLTKSDGKKFGKSDEGNIWLDPKMTSPYRFYQFFLNVDDAMLPKLMRYFSLKSKEEVEAIEKEYADNPQEYKRILAKEITIRVHSEEMFNSVMNVSEILFNKKASAEKLMSMTLQELETISNEIPCYKVKREDMDSTDIISLVSELTDIVSSKSEARRAIKGNAISLNKTKISDFEYKITVENLIRDKYLMIENGKKNKYIIEVA